jgi:hypothetical protein
VAREAKLCRVVEDWGSKPGDGFLYYMFRPPWVHAAVTGAYFSLHPREREHKTSLASKLRSEVEAAKVIVTAEVPR